MKRGFTLLEMLVAALIMAVAVSASISAIGNSIRNAARLTAYDRAVMLARAKMDEILVDQRLPIGTRFEGTFTNGIQADNTSVDNTIGWSALLTPYAMRQGVPPGTPILERVQLEIWWMSGGTRHVFPLEGYKRAVVPSPSL